MFWNTKLEGDNSRVFIKLQQQTDLLSPSDFGSGLLTEVQGTLNPLQRTSKTGATWVDPIQPLSGSNHWSQCG
jgi:hypothetical protein